MQYLTDTSSSDAIDGLPVSSTNAELTIPNDDNATPRASQIPAQQSASTLPIIPQTTGEWFRLQQLQLPSFRRSLLGGKSFNRFSSFVTSGAEAFVLRGPSSVQSSQVAEEPSDGHKRETTQDIDIDEEDEKRPAARADETLKDSEKHYIDFGPQWRSKVPLFEVRVHSPEKFVPLASAGGSSAAYTMYSVTSIFDEPHGHTRNSSSSSTTVKAATSPQAAAHQMTVHRRFSHFVFLHSALTRLLPGIALPPLPEKQYAGRFSDAFVEARRADLHRYLSKVVRHPLTRYTEVLMFFLGCESDFVSSRASRLYLNIDAVNHALL